MLVGILETKADPRCWIKPVGVHMQEIPKPCKGLNLLVPSKQVQKFGQQRCSTSPGNDALFDLRSISKP